MSSELVVPGENVGENARPGDNVFEEDGGIYSEVYGFKREGGNHVSVIPIKGTYVPEEGDQVVGIVKDLDHATWTVDLNSPYEGTLHISRVEEELNQGRLEEYMAIGDVMRVLIDEVDREYDVELSLKPDRCGPLRRGRVVTVEPTRVPRLIGREGSMIGTIRTEADVEIFVGNNGRVWIRGDERGEDLAADTVRFVAENAHEDNLTEKVKNFMEDW